MAMPSHESAAGGGDSAACAFRFVQQLAEEVSLGRVELPGLPDVAVQLQRALSNPQVTTAMLLRIVSHEPVLAGRLIQMANSAALGRSGAPVADLRTAINRMGFDLLRGAAISFAMEQVRRSAELKSIAKPMQALWQRSVNVAVTCYGFACRYTKVNPDTAMLAGLLHSIGRLYIMVRASRNPGLLEDPALYQTVVRDWHTNIAKALLENWNVPEEIAQSVADCEDLERDHRGAIDLTDVLTAGCLLVAHQASPKTLEVHLTSVKAFARVAMKHEDCAALLGEAAEDLRSLRSALGA